MSIQDYRACAGAFKLKGSSNDAEGYPAAEMNHGPITLIEPDTPSTRVPLL
jgi:glucosamine 6-phosphate synthetase-like amidotransferase/phosphosugar isomerase protein